MLKQPRTGISQTHRVEWRIGQNGQYAPELVNTVFRGLRQQMLDDGWVSELELEFAGPSPSEPVFDFKDESATQWVDELDDLTGAQLPGNFVHAGKMEEIRWVKEIGQENQ